MKRSVWFWMYFVIAIILAIYFATRIFMNFSAMGEMSYVRRISISADTANKDLTPIATAAAVGPGTRAIGQTLRDINTRVAAAPGVKFSATHRTPDGNLEIHVELYKPVAQWTDGAQYYPLSADGTIVKSPSDARTPNTVVFRGTIPDNISEITNAAHNIVSELDYLEMQEGRRWNLHTTGDITVMLPEKSPESAIAQLIILNDKHNILSKDIEIIDMRDDARILIK